MATICRAPNNCNQKSASGNLVLWVNLLNKKRANLQYVHFSCHVMFPVAKDGRELARGYEKALARERLYLFHEHLHL